LKAKPQRAPRPNRVGQGPTGHKSESPDRRIRELARGSGARPFRPEAFAGIVPPGEDIDAFVDEIYRART